MLAENIKQLRMNCKLSQAEFGKIFHVSQGAVSQWENGTTRPDTEQLYEIAVAFSLHIEDLIQDEPVASHITPGAYAYANYLPSVHAAMRENESAPLSFAEKQMMENYKSMNPEGQNLFRKMSEVLKEMHPSEEESSPDNPEDP